MATPDMWLFVINSFIAFASLSDHLLSHVSMKVPIVSLLTFRTSKQAWKVCGNDCYRYHVASAK